MTKFDRNNFEYQGWLERTLPRLDALEARINALDGKPYWGYGFHYGKHDEITFLRKVLAEPVIIDPTADSKTIQTTFSKQIIWQVRFEGLEEKVLEAETEIKTGVRPEEKKRK